MILKTVTCFLLLCALMAHKSEVMAQPAPGLKLAVANNAPPEVLASAQRILRAATEADSPSLLRVLGQGGKPASLTDSAALLDGKLEERAYNHLIVVGLPQDPLVAACWQREARIEADGLYAFGWGHFRGDIGYVESGRNPFLHSARIASAPFETHVVTLTGTSPQGVALAVEAFLTRGLLHGVVAAPNVKRVRESLLDREALPAGFSTGVNIPLQAGDATLLGVSASGADESRGVLADVGTEPLAIWRARYFLPGAWGARGAAGAFANFGQSLDRRAYGNTLWAAHFPSPQAAAQAAPKIAAAARLGKVADFWSGKQPPYADGKYFGDQPSSGPLRLWQAGSWVFMSTLPEASTRIVQSQSLSPS